MDSSASNNIELLLAHFDDQKPVLSGGLDTDAAGNASKPEERPELPNFRNDAEDPNSLPDQRWGLIVPDGPKGDRLLEITASLRKRREEQQGEKSIVFR